MILQRRPKEAKSPSLTVYSRLQDARAAWRELYDASPVSPYQNYDYVRLWFDAFARELGVEPHIAVATDCDGTPLALLPFAIRPILGLRVAEFPCGRESNFNLALVRPGVALDFRSLLLEAARSSPAAFDLYFLRNQPRRFGGRENPLVCQTLAAVPAPPVEERSLASTASPLAPARGRAIASAG